MKLESIKDEIRPILMDEERPVVDWPRVAARCFELNARLMEESSFWRDHEIAAHYLDDPDIRKKDARCGSWQRQQLRAWLEEAR